MDASDHPSQKRSNFDAVQKILKNLEAAGIRVDQDYLCTIVMSKFSRDILPSALKEVKRVNSLNNVSDFMEAIDSVLQIEEDII